MEMVLRKLSNGELVGIDLTHNVEGRRYAVVRPIGWVISDPGLMREAWLEARLLNADEINVLVCEGE